ncbi:MAG: VWA domain-containing protein [Aggregatilineales bacterium]
MFQNESLLLLLLIVPVFMMFYGWRVRVAHHSLRNVVDQSLLSTLVYGDISRRRAIKAGLFILTLICLIVAIARPVWGVVEEVTQVQGVSIMVVLDVSASMDAEDVLPSRLIRAKLAIRELMDNRRGDEFGLILFAGTAFIQMPLTADINTAINFLDAASSDSISNQGTAVGDALDLARQSFSARSLPFSTIVLLTDGENHQGDPEEAARQLGELGIPVHVIGYGDPVDGVPIPVRDESGEVITYKSDRAGNLVLTRLDEDILQEIATITSGTYQRAGESGIEVIDLINAIDTIDSGTLEESLQVRQIERFGIFVLLAVVFLSLEMFIPEAKRVP